MLDFGACEQRLGNANILAGSLAFICASQAENHKDVCCMQDTRYKRQDIAWTGLMDMSCVCVKGKKKERIMRLFWVVSPPSICHTPCHSWRGGATSIINHLSAQVVQAAQWRRKGGDSQAPLPGQVIHDVSGGRKKSRPTARDSMYLGAQTS